MPLPPLSEPKGWPRLLGIFKGSIAAIALFSVLLGINLLQMLSLLLRPFSARAFRSFNRGCAQFWWGFSHVWAEKWYGIEFVVTGDPLPKKENVFVVCNHQEMPDIPVLFKIGYECERLGDLKWFVKDVLKYVPGVGWGMLFLDCIFVKRNWTSDKEYITRIFAKFIKHDIPVWIVSFVEGTRIRPSKLERSNQYAEKNGLPPTEHVLLPRSKGFSATVAALRSHLDAVYDVTIGYVDGVPTIWQWFKVSSPKVHIDVRRFPLAELPEDEDELGQWLQDRFYIKDRRLGHFYESDTLDHPTLEEPRT